MNTVQSDGVHNTKEARMYRHEIEIVALKCGVCAVSGSLIGFRATGETRNWNDVTDVHTKRPDFPPLL